MKGFLKSFFASVLGCFVAMGIICFVMIVTLIGMTISQDSKYYVQDNTVLKIKLDGNLTDRSNVDPIGKLLNGDKTKELSLVNVLKGIKIAKENEDVKGIYIESGILSASSASIKEIRDALIDFKTSGKFIVSYGDIYTQNAYYLSSVSDNILINPYGKLDLSGMSSSPMFFKHLAEKIGVKMQVFKVGTFKSAVEPYILDKMSDANRQQVSSYLNDSWKTLSTEVAESRGLSIEKINILADSLQALQETSTYITSNLVDSLIYQPDLETFFKSKLQLEEKQDVKFASLNNILSVKIKKSDKEDDNNIVAVLFAEGTITSGTSKYEITDKNFVKELNKLRDNDKVKAVVFRVNSPGGSAFASEQIWKAVSDLKTKKPVVVSMGTYAASGGYYISCCASKIIAQPNTLTGSIGIFGLIPSFEGLATKIGVDFDNVKTNKFSDFGSIYRDMNVAEKSLMQAEIERGYDLFLTRCSDGRNIAKDSLNLIAQGRVWTGRQALEIGLVDKLGGINIAVEEAVQLAELDKYSIRNYPGKPDFMEELLASFENKMAVNALEEYLGVDAEYLKFLKEMKNLKDIDYIQARLPFDFPVQ